MAKIRVAVFFTTLEKGGTEHQAMLLLENADREKFDLHAISIVDGPLRQQIAALHIPVTVLNAGKPRLRESIAVLRNYLKAQNIHVLHCLLWHSNMIGRFACMGLKTKCINSIRWAERQPRDIIDYCTRFSVDHWIANSKHGAKTALLPKSKSTVIPNGMPDELLKVPLTAWRPKDRTAVMVGKFRREKRFDVLIEAARFLPDWKFTLVGDGPEQAQAEQLARRIHAKNVVFAGQRSDVHRILLEHQVSLLLSRSEGNPNVTIESLALGVPFIGSDIPAHREILGHGRGVIVPSEPQAVAAAIQRLAETDKKQLDRTRKAGQEYVQQLYSTKHMVEQTQAVWQQVLQ